MDVAIVELQPNAGLQRESYQKIKKKVPYAVKQIFFSLFWIYKLEHTFFFAIFRLFLEILPGPLSNKMVSA